MKTTHAFVAVAIAGAIAFPGVAEATKQGDFNQLVSLGAQYNSLKGQANDPAVAEQLAGILAEYEILSGSLGGDDPGGLLGGSSGGSFGGGAGLLGAPPDPPGGTTTTTNFANNTPTAIPDGPGGNAMSTISVAGADPVIWDVDLNVAITHTFAADLDITLTSPGGTTIVVTTDNGAGNDDVFNGTLFDDDAPNTVTDFIYVNGMTATPLQPEGALGAFIGEDPNGMWTISITDDAGADTGTLNSWSLDITTLAAPTVDDAPANFANNTPTAIPDGPGGNVQSQISIAGAATFACDINFTVAITHTFAADLDITLTSPGGTTIVVTTDNGAGNDNVFNGTLFDDDAPNTVTDFIYVNGMTATPLQPEGALGAFIGEDPNGTWTLDITDDAGADVGTLNSWSIDVVTCAGAGGGGGGDVIVAIPTLNHLALVALAAVLALTAFVVLRRRRT